MLEKTQEELKKEFLVAGGLDYSKKSVVEKLMRRVNSDIQVEIRRIDHERLESRARGRTKPAGLSYAVEKNEEEFNVCEKTA